MRSIHLLIGFAGFALLATSANAATISQDFESLSIGSTATPTDWTYVKPSSDPANAYITVAGDGGGVGAQISGNNDVNGLHPPGSYIVNSGSTAMDVPLYHHG